MRISTQRLVARLAPLGLLGLLAALVRWHWQLPYPDARWSHMDHYRYIALAQQPFGSANPLAHEPPFCWRILTPLVVHLLPLPTLDGFWLVTLVGLAGTVLALQWVLRGLELPVGTLAPAGLAFVLLGPATGFDLWAYQLVDPLALCLTTLMIGCAVHRRGRLLVFLALAGALAKETTLLGPLFALIWSYSQRDRRQLRWSALAMLVALGDEVALRLLIVPSRPYSFLGEVIRVYLPFPSLTFSGRLLLYLTVLIAVRCMAATVGAWGALLPLALLQLRHAPRFWRRYPAFGVLLVAATAQVLVSWDVERVVIYAFPAMIAACAYEIEYLAPRWRCPRWALWLPVMAIEAVYWLPNAGWPVLTQNPGMHWALDWPHALLACVLLLATVGLMASRRWNLLLPRPKTGYEAAGE